jgi:excisionase family DNA binding protein
MNKSEAAEFLGVSLRAVERYASAGRLPSCYVRGKTGQVLDFDQVDLEAFKIELETPVSKGTTSHAEARQATQSATANQSAEDSTSPENGALATFGGALSGALALTPQEYFELGVMMADKLRQDAPQAPTVAIEARLFFTVTEAAQLAGVGKSAIEAAIKSGQIKAHSGLGRGRRVKRADVEKWAKAL